MQGVKKREFNNKAISASILHINIYIYIYLSIKIINSIRNIELGQEHKQQHKRFAGSLIGRESLLIK